MGIKCGFGLNSLREPEMTLSLNVLIVEDEWLIGEDLRDRLEALGATVVDVARDCATALGILARDRVDAAFVDTKLGQETSEPVIEVCDSKGIPVVVTSGHVPHDLPERLRGRLMVSKPFFEKAIEESYRACLDSVLGRRLGPDEVASSPA
jgi:DNA-binding NtrC family response regulator